MDTDPPRAPDTPITTTLRGRVLLDTPILNKSTAFTHEERHALGLEGLLPHRVETIETHLERTREEYSLKTTDVGRHVFLRSLQDTNEVLFHRFLADHLEDLLPIVYTPTVGDACRRFSHIYRHPRGLFVAEPDLHHVDEMLENVARPHPDVIVVTDGERILGLGDQGVGGMGIPIGKLSLYTAFGGIDPARTLPVLLDAGTDNQELLDDPLYMGWHHERIRGERYDRFVDGFVQAVRRHFPHVLLQWEDFARDTATPLLERYRDQILSFNDDIQGTAAVTLAVVLAGLRSTGRTLRDQRICVVGAGSAGTGIAEQVVRALVSAGLDEDDARRRLYLVDRQGLLHDRMEDLEPFQARFAQPHEAVRDWAAAERPGGGDGRIELLDVVRHAHPSVLVGVSGQPGLFTEEVVRELAAGCERPVILPLSNPTSRAEARPADLLAWTDSRAMVATGSPFDDVTLEGTTHEIAQANNVYVFPGLGLGTVASGATKVSDEMLTAAAWTLSDAAPCLDDDRGRSLLPALTDVRELSRTIALAVAREAQRHGLAEERSEEELARRVDELRWTPRYRPILPG